MSDHDLMCPNYKGSCCPWMGECDCQCMCDFITVIRESMKPECTCGQDNLSYVFHLVPCKQGAFLMSQDNTRSSVLDNDG